MTEPTSNDVIDEIIKEVSLKHGFVLPRTDPALMIYTINRRLANDHKVALEKVTEIFKSDLESVYNRWVTESLANAKKIQEAAIEAGKNQIATAIQGSVDGLPAIVRTELSKQISPTLGKMDKLVRWNMYAGAAILLATTVLFWLVMRK